MNRDLEEQLDEMGPEYRAVVTRLRAAREAGEEMTTGETRVTRGTRGWLVAASLLIAIALAVPCLSRLSCPSCPSSFLPPREYRASVSEMIATQNADGSWKNDFLTRRNAAALRGSSNPAALIAYKKAVRYLHAKGLEPMNG